MVKSIVNLPWLTAVFALCLGFWLTGCSGQGEPSTSDRGSFVLKANINLGTEPQGFNSPGSYYLRLGLRNDEGPLRVSGSEVATIYGDEEGVVNLDGVSSKVVKWQKNANGSVSFAMPIASEVLEQFPTGVKVVAYKDGKVLGTYDWDVALDPPVVEFLCVLYPHPFPTPEPAL